MIAAECQSVSDEAVVNTLNDEFVNFVLYPYEYNRTYKISRVFFPVFATYQDLKKKIFANRFGKYYDGLLIMLLADAETQLEDVSEISIEIPRSIVFANNDIYELKRAVKNYIAVKYLDSQKTKYTAKDPAFEKELQYFREELQVEILNAIQNWKESYGDSALIVSSGKILKGVHSSASLSTAASGIMKKYYCIDDNGECGLPDLVTRFMDFYRKRITEGKLAEKDASCFSKPDCSYEDAEKVILIYPVKRFAEIGALNYDKDSQTVSIDSSIWSTLSNGEKQSIELRCDEKIKEYFEKLEA